MTKDRPARIGSVRSLMSRSAGKFGRPFLFKES